MKLELDEIFSVIDKVNDAGLDSFAYRDTDIRLSIKRKNGGAQEDPHRESRQRRTDLRDAARKADEGSAPDETENLTINCPMVGTFYAAAAEDKAPFVTEGDRVKKGQVIGIVEAMKLMNEIESEYDGVVEEILVRNGQLVEYGQPLMRLREE